MDGLYGGGRRSWRRAGECLLAGAVALTSSSPAAGDWAAVGPFGGQISALAVASSGVIYASTDTVLYRSLDRGRHWVPSGDGLPPAPAYPVTVPGHPLIVYAATGFGLYTSADGGAHWMPAGGGLNLEGDGILALAASADGSAIYLLGFDSLFRANPGEDSWQPIALPADHVQYAETLTLDSRDPATLYVGTGNGTFLRSRDGGATWSQLSIDGFPFLEIPQVVVDPSTPLGLYAIGGGMVFHSTNDGESWTPLTFPVPAHFGSLAVGQSGEVYLGLWDRLEALNFTSSDGGATWRSASDGGLADRVLVFLPVAGSGRVYAGGASGFWRSLDGGRHWGALDDGILAQRVRSLAVAAEDGVDLLLASVSLPLSPSGGAVYRASARGAWTEVDRAGDLVYAADPRHPDVLYGSVRQPAAVLAKSLDGGATWTPLPFPGSDNSNTVVVDPKSSRTVYAGGLPAPGVNDTACHLLRSADAGASWSCLSGKLAMGALAIDPTRTSTLYLLSGTVFKSQNSGATWTGAGHGLPSGVALSSLAIDPVDPRRIYAGRGGEIALYRSADAGRTWSPAGQRLPEPVTALLVDPRTPSTLYAGVPEIGVFRSTDRGVTWQEINAGLPAIGFTGQLLLGPSRPSTLYAVVDGVGVFAFDTAQ